MSGVEVNPPADLARTEFNLYLRFITTPLVFLITLVAAGMAAEGIVSERTRETWDSLIATPLTARDILRSKMLAALWRMRVILATLLALWTIGLIAGAIHPAGYLVSLLVVAAWTWLMLVFGMSISIAAKDMAATTNRTMGLVFLTTGTSLFPSFCRRMMNSVLLGAGSPPFVAWLSLVSYRDVRNAWQYSVYPALQWMQIDTREGPLSVAATCLLGIIIPTVWGLLPLARRPGQLRPSDWPALQDDKRGQFSCEMRCVRMGFLRQSDSDALDTYNEVAPHTVRRQGIDGSGLRLPTLNLGREGLTG